MVSRPAGTSGGAPITYRIDRDDRLIEVCDNWHVFAVQNGGPTPHATALLGRTLWEFIADPPTVHLYQLMVDRVRRGATAVRFQLRCDAPDRRRLITMEISGADAGIVTFRATPIYEARTATSTAATAGAAGLPLLPVCSWCSRFRLVGDHWVEAETAVDALGIFQTSTVPDVGRSIAAISRITVLFPAPEGPRR
jgi:hypothetical protein